MLTGRERYKDQAPLPLRRGCGAGFPRPPSQSSGVLAAHLVCVKNENANTFSQSTELTHPYQSSTARPTDSYQLTKHRL